MSLVVHSPEIEVSQPSRASPPLELGANIAYTHLNIGLEEVELGQTVLDYAQTCRKGGKTDQNGLLYLPLTTSNIPYTYLNLGVEVVRGR